MHIHVSVENLEDSIRFYPAMFGGAEPSVLKDDYCKWELTDPASAEGSEESKQQAIWDAAVIVKRRIELFLSLPLDKLDAVAMIKAVHDIGKQ
ncbi:hypothetical protein FAZ69_04195 [Trinickia terrae]|uniref:Protein-tyrosine-phosphatase n=1 Tax=Trinickia terrae TaxID=2571161 RepID=A0A4U1IDD2_9BURK|nr:hypothetical protein FAZ69_04195 [Trinickia terrae]